MNRYYSNVLYNEWLNKHQHNITQDNEVLVTELGKGEVVYNVGITTVKRLPSPSVYSNVLYNGIIPITLPLPDSSESEVGRFIRRSVTFHSLPHSIIRGDKK